MFQVSTPVELPTVTIVPKQEVPKASTLPPPVAVKVPVATNPVPRSDSQVSSNAAAAAALPVDDGDEELDQLLSLQKPVLSGLENGSTADEERAAPKKGDDSVLVW